MNLVHAPGELPELAGGTVGALHCADHRGQEVCIQAGQILRSRSPLLAGYRQGRVVGPRDALVVDQEVRRSTLGLSFGLRSPQASHTTRRW